MLEAPVAHGLADLLERLDRRSPAIRAGARLLRLPPPAPEMQRLDTRSALIERHWRALEAGLAGLTRDEAGALLSIESMSFPDLGTGEDGIFDSLALAFLSGPEPWRERARPLALALARLLEDAPRLNTDLNQPLGVGFEDLLDRRMAGRFARLPGRAALLSILYEHHLFLLEEPEEAERAIEQSLGEPLSAEDREWLAAERLVGLLRFVRTRKTTREGHIRWYAAPDRHGRPVLERLGAGGHWLLLGNGGEAGLTRLGTAAERVLVPPGAAPAPGWCVVSTLEPGSLASTGLEEILLEVSRVLEVPEELAAEEDAWKLRPQIREAVAASPSPVSGPLRLDARLFTPREVLADRPSGSSALAVHGEKLALLFSQSGEEPWELSSIPLEPADAELFDFLGLLDRIADLAPPTDRIAASIAASVKQSAAVAWSRALLKIRDQEIPGPGRLAGMKVRILYVLSSIPHPLGGVPEVGAAFLCDHLERDGARVDFLKIRPDEIDARLPELLGADAIGCGVYIHNREEVAILLQALRRAGFQGKIVLGGPEVRHIDRVQETISGWDAIIRGEGEEMLPEVLDILRQVDAGGLQEALTRIGNLRGVVFRFGQAVLLCDTAAQNRASVISCPLPYGWSRGGRRQLYMNFTRGCPYVCTFCPNHQGRAYRAGPVEELWRYSVLAVADHFSLPQEIEHGIARSLQERLGVASPPRLSLALHLLWRRGLDREELESLLSHFGDSLQRSERTLGLETNLWQRLERLEEIRGPRIGHWQGKEIWLLAKAELLKSRPQERPRGHAGRFVIRTSEDNTLVNRDVISEYLDRRRAYGLHNDFLFNPGQNTIRDLLKGSTEVNEELIGRLLAENPCVISFGTDGPSNAVIRQSYKPGYGVTGLLAVNRAFGRRRIRAANNYILLTAETSLLEAVESFLLFLLLPVHWRYHGKSINLRVIKEEATLATDEGLIFAPEDESYDVPLRFPEVQALLDRWSLTSYVASSEIRPLLRRMLAEDPEASSLLPRVLERWERNVDRDPELVALARLVREEMHDREPLAQALWRVESYIHREGLAEGRHTVATFRDLSPIAETLQSGTR